MITVALDTATDRCSVAAANGEIVASRHLDGARRHAGAVLLLLGEVLEDVGATSRRIDRIITADGPGSFTGLRVAATVAKALTWRSQTSWHVAPSLLVRAMAHRGTGDSVILALSDALRGEVYAGCWRVTASGISAVGPSPRAMRPVDLAQFGAVDVLVGSVPSAIQEEAEAVTARVLIGGPGAMPDARMLLSLDRFPGGTTAIADTVHWEPDYGRPAEAQAVWERKHGRALPDSIHIAR